MTSKGKSTAGMMSAVAIAASTAILPASASAQTQASEAESIRSLSIMLMVTSLRCRTTDFDFREEYRRFNVAHKQHLSGAGRTLRKEMSARHGARGSNRALDRISVQIANSYGDGHPWLECDELKQITHDLSLHRDKVQLSQTARKLLGNAPAPVMVMKDIRVADLALASLP